MVWRGVVQCGKLTCWLECAAQTCTVAAPSVLRPLFADPIDPPTMSMSFGVNDSALAVRRSSLAIVIMRC
jgi:predicted membrane GTPase involved in stress response